MSLARVIAEHKEVYKVKDGDGEYSARVTGKQMFDATEREDYPAVGDWVDITKEDADNATIHSISPRKTILKKKYSGKHGAQIIATNVDTALIVEALDRDYNLNRIERYVVLASETGIEPIIVLNKADIIQDIELQEKIQEVKMRFSDIKVIATSTVTKDGLDELKNLIMKDKTYCLLGSSGVGKSSLINKLLQSDELKTQEIGASTQRGKHTTTSREMYFLKSGGVIIDNPGTREVGMADVTTGIDNVFDTITTLASECKYADCTHIHEPGCAVLQAVEDQELDQEHYQNYIKLQKENEFYEMTDDERHEKDRKFGKFVKKSLKEVHKFKNQ